MSRGHSRWSLVTGVQSCALPSSGSQEALPPLAQVQDRLGIAQLTPNVLRKLPRRVHRRAIDAGELRDVTAHVGPVRIEALGLAQRVEPAVRSRVGSGARHPLPVELVVGDVTVDQVMHEVPRALTPVDVVCLTQTTTEQQPAAVVHNATAPTL